MFKELRGDAIRSEIEEHIHAAVARLKEQGTEPKLAIIRAGEDSGQMYYESAILRQSEEYGIETQAINFGDDVSQARLEVTLQALNEDESVHGIIMLRPLPKTIDGERLRTMISPAKDVDAITDISMAELFAGKGDAFKACAAEACMEVLHHYDIEPEGKKVTIIGRSLTVGRPLTIMMLGDNATVTVCHRSTSKEDLIAACKGADIVVLAAGLTLEYGSEYFRDGQIVVDVGTGTGGDGKMHGDLNIDEIKASGKIKDLTYTPVPGGVGMVTTAILFRNIIKGIQRKR